MARTAVADAAVPSATFVPEAVAGASGAMIGGAMMMVDVSVPVAMPVPDAGEEPAVSANAVPTRNESHCLTAPNAEVLVDPADDGDDEAGAAEVTGADEDAGAEVETGVEVAAKTTAVGVVVVVGVVTEVEVVVLAGAGVVVVAMIVVGVVVAVVEAAIVGAEMEDDAVVLASVEEETAEAVRPVLDGAEGGTITVEEAGAGAVDDETDGPAETPAPDGAETKIDVEATEPSPICQYSVSPTFVIIPEPENPGGTNPPQNICVPDAANTAEPASVN